MIAAGFRPCIVIPVYNHPVAIRGTVANLLPHGLPVYLVDDGSDQATQDALSRIRAEFPLVRASRLPRNRGKGAAVMSGMKLAFGDGMTHALQIDADGQHDAADVPRFVARAAARPDALICGAPVYDGSAPRLRQYGRYVNHAWVWVETLSFAIRDSMCGFRLYPLAAACALIADETVPEHMDFDTAMAVRLAWRGVPVENLRTRVIYPTGGVSHFDMVRDNLRITRTHARLVCGMLARLPLLLWRKVAPRPAPGEMHWARMTERGSSLGLRFTAACYRRFGERAARLVLYPVVAYFMLTGGAARRASRDYFARLRAHAGPGARLPGPGWRTTFRHLFNFAESGLHKLSAWTGELDTAGVDFPNRAEFEALVASGTGALLIGAHLGNLEMARALAFNNHLATVNAVVYSEHAQRFRTLLAGASGKFDVNLIHVPSLGPDTMIGLKGKVDRGELLVIVGDRTPPAEGGRVCMAEFLGSPAPFAQGPFILGALLECPVYLFFCLKEGAVYRIHLERFADRIELPRPERDARLEAYVQRYAARLQYYCLRAPYQWFNFYNYWSAGAPAIAGAANRDRPRKTTHAQQD